MSDLHKQVTQHPRQRCYFCGSEGPIETHHVVPRRHGGSDGDDNLVDLCPTCHRRLEVLYDGRFYNELGVETDTEDADQLNLSSRDQRKLTKSIKDTVSLLESEHEQGAPVIEVYDRIVDNHDMISADDAEAVVDKLRSKGKVYESTKGRLRTT